MCCNDKQLDLVLSGVNRGRNVGEDVIYSGTIAGAMEGALLGIPSIALSQSYKSRSGKPPFWETGLRFAPDIIKQVLGTGMRKDLLVNVNFPDCAPEDVKGITVAPLGRRRQERLHIDKRFDGRHNPYYWIAYSLQMKIDRRTRHRHRGARRSHHRGDAAEDRHHRRADHDAARGAVRKADLTQLFRLRIGDGLDRFGERFDLERLLQGR